MAGQVKNLKVKGGRFYARVAVPSHLRQIIGKTELVAPLGGERRAAMKALPAAVATLQRQIDAAGLEAAGDRIGELRSPITTQDFGRAVWSRYQAMLQGDDATRAAYPSPAEIEAARDEAIRRFQRDGTRHGFSITAQLMILSGMVTGRFVSCALSSIQPAPNRAAGSSFTRGRSGSFARSMGRAMLTAIGSCAMYSC